MVRLRNSFRRRRSGGVVPLVLAAGLGVGMVGLVSGGGGAGAGGGAPSYGVADQPAPSTSCDIKGNISVKNGARIYHVPGQKYYAETRINTGQGERWFCSEAEARAAGWRKSKV